jgi:hypothetical protein
METMFDPPAPSLPPTFAQALARFLDEAQALIDAERNARFPNLDRSVLTPDPGRRYVRIWCDRGNGTKYAYCFVDKTNGDVLKPATWKAPAKHARGNVFKGQAADSVTAYGARYL